MKSDQDILSTLSSAKLFKSFTKDSLTDVLSLLDGKITSMHPKESLYKESNIVSTIGCVLSGEIVVSSYNPSGKEILMTKLHKGDTFGANIAFTTTQISPYFFYSARSSTIYSFKISKLRKLPAKYSSILYENLLNQLSNDSIKHQYRIDILCQKNANLRILSYLKQQQNKRNTDEFCIPYNREEMANYLCLNRSVLSHQLSLLQQEGYIEFKNNYFKILK